jgi:hypothetical protein
MRALLRHLLLSLPLLLAVARHVRAEPAAADTDAGTGRWHVGSSAWVFANAFADPSPHFYYLEVDRTIDDRNALVLETLTWTYHAPIGIPYGSSFGDPAEDYPGFVRSVGVGLGWRRDLYRGLDASVRSFHFLQLYHEDGQPRKTGYQLFLQTRIGWRWTSGTPGFWIEPAVAFNWWPLEVGRPDSFRAMDDRWPSYFLFEPWLNAGWRW